MKPFNLKEYLEDPSRKVVTRDGRDARIICTDRLTGVYPVVALWIDEDLNGNPYEKIDSYTINGKYDAVLENEQDLFFASGEHREGWVNIYRNKTNGENFCGKIYDSEDDAKSQTDILTTIKIEWEE